MATNSFADKLVKKLFGSSSDVFLNNVKSTVVDINALEPKIQAMTDEQLQAQTPKFKELIQKHLEGIEDKEERRKAEQEILHEHLNHCVAHAFHAGSERDRRIKIEELIEVLDRRR